MIALCIAFGAAALVFVQRFAEAALERELADALRRSATVYERFTALRYGLLSSQARALAQAPHLRAVVGIPEVDHETVFYTVEQLFAALDTGLMLVLDENGQLLADASEAGRFGNDLRTWPGIREGLAGTEFVGVWSYHDHLYDIALTPIVLGDQLLGLMILGQRLDVEAAAEIHEYTGQEALILYGGHPVAHSGGTVIPAVGSDLTAHLVSGSTELFKTTIGGQACLASALPLAVNEGYVVLFHPLGEIEADIARLNLSILAAGVLALAVAVLISLRFSTAVGGRIQELTGTMARVSQDDYDVRITDRGNDEVSVLVRGFNEMLEQIQQRDIALNQSLQDRELLLKEVHHRVKNNLQVISSLLSLQANQTQDPGTAAALQESRSRIGSMALVHEQLYDSDDFSHVNLRQYVSLLTAELSRAYSDPRIQIDLQQRIQDLDIDVGVAISCGLIINELLTNIFKYAFVGRDRGSIEVKFYRNSAGLDTLVIRDDGVGLPANVDPSRTTSLGLQIVSTLIKQLQGDMMLNRDGGTEFTIIFARGARRS